MQGPYTHAGCMPAVCFLVLYTFLPISHSKQAAMTASLQNAPSDVINVKSTRLSSSCILIKHFAAYGIVDFAVLDRLFF